MPKQIRTWLNKDQKDVVSLYRRIRRRVQKQDGSKRSSYEVLFIMLKAINDDTESNGTGAKVSHIIFKGGLNIESFYRYINYCMSKGLVEDIQINGKKRKLYILTERGKKILELLQKYLETEKNLKTLGEQILEFLGSG